MPCDYPSVLSLSLSLSLSESWDEILLGAGESYGQVKKARRKKEETGERRVRKGKRGKEKERERRGGRRESRARACDGKLREDSDVQR